MKQTRGWKGATDAHTDGQTLTDGHGVKSMSLWIALMEILQTAHSEWVIQIIKLIIMYSNTPEKTTEVLCSGYFR